MGALLAQLERLKGKLHSEGLFDPARKKPLPFAPKTIGVITSPTGAVIRDILHRIRDRWPCRVVVWPVVVQEMPHRHRLSVRSKVLRAVKRRNRM